MILSPGVTITLLIASFSYVFAQYLPDSQALVLNELEHLYLDNTGPNGFKASIAPCTRYIDSSTGGLPNNTLGEQASAQWIRTAFRKNVLSYLMGIKSPHLRDAYLPIWTSCMYFVIQQAAILH